ncbi:hypothetical protein DEO72_LG10g1822 [Vigna unguiculata]|uniref:Uncharacterized protein n=1 Tax=Vigna unguiculata TaxID=3917 RepID=A0A4D6NCF6_VIGUN|nr:hypothetical protein DEO72_LG10g1822 [Vigna unguiculata]
MNLPAHIITCNTSHEPTRSWHNISQSKQSIIVSQTTPGSKGQQRLRLAQPARRQAKMLQTALAVFTHRQALAPPQTHYFLVIAWRSTPCRQAPNNTETPDASLTAWRIYPCRQAPYQ